MDKVKEETKCEFYDNYECNAYYDIYPEPEDCQRDLCRTHEDCYYRQIKRLEQENEKLKKELEKHKSMIAHNLKPLFDSDFQNKLKELEQENKHYRKEAYRLADGLNKTENLAFTYKQALQEIRKIAREWLNNDWSCFHCRNNMDEKLKEILDLITKAEEE